MLPWLKAQDPRYEHQGMRAPQAFSPRPRPARPAARPRKETFSERLKLVAIFFKICTRCIKPLLLESFKELPQLPPPTLLTPPPGSSSGFLALPSPLVYLVITHH